MSAYEKAIAAYQFQVERYHTWMNYYSLFNGALFVGVYSLYNKDNAFLLILLSSLGLIASLCWLGSLIGNIAWMNSWLQIVRKEEELVASATSTPPTPPTKIYNTLYCKRGKERTFLSTQSLTKTFVSFIIIAWCITIGYIAANMFYNIFIAILFIVVILIVSILLYYRQKSFIHSNINHMTKIKFILLAVILFCSCNNTKSNVPSEADQIDKPVTEEIENGTEDTEDYATEDVRFGEERMAEDIEEKELVWSFLPRKIMNIWTLIDGIDKDPIMLKKICHMMETICGSPFYMIQDGVVEKIDLEEKGCKITIKSGDYRQYSHLIIYLPEDKVKFSVKDVIHCFFSIKKIETQYYEIVAEAAIVSTTEDGIIQQLKDINKAVKANNMDRLKSYFDIKLNPFDENANYTESSIKLYKHVIDLWPSFPYQDEIGHIKAEERAKELEGLFE